ncbi:MAG: peptide deformylase [Candidatus Paceibacterota bacterium]|jgi:peptide deformylase
MSTEIVQQNEPVLREIAQEIPIKDIKSPRIQKILKDMKVALASQDDGVAIAAPQIGVPLRIFVVAGALFDMIKNEEEGGKDLVKRKTKKEVSPDMVFINPVVTKLSKTTEMMEEGCLSVRYLYGKVRRSTKATVQAYDENGKKFERGGSGMLAQVFQHETDHLDGTLFIDKAVDVEDLPPPEKKK